MTQSERQIEIRLDRRIALLAGGFVYLFTLAHLAVNTASSVTEYARFGEPVSTAFAGFIEASSVFWILALFIPLALLERRFPLTTTRWPVMVPLYLAAALAYATVHIFAMAWTRELLAPVLFGFDYRFFEDPVRDFVYELRKDVLTFASHLFILTGFRAVETHRMEARGAHAEARQTRRLTLKCGGRVIRLDAREFRTAKGAGNYVEVHTQAGEHLARMTLSELETQLTEAGVDAVRVHRSWLVNRDRIEEIIPTGEGDVTLVLTGGLRIPGSRRYRNRLEAA